MEVIHMARITIVRGIYHEQYKDHAESPHHEDVICGAFSSRLKAVSWTKEQFEIDHRGADKTYLGEGRLNKYDLDVGAIKEGVPIKAWEYSDDEIDIQQYYMFDSYELI